MTSDPLNNWKAQRIGPPLIQLSPRCVRYAESDIQYVPADQEFVLRSVLFPVFPPGPQRRQTSFAMVWAPFDFLIDGKVDHCGTDLFNLVRQDGKWLIASVADTGRKDCPVKQHR
jgi:hypothetical protein